MLPVFTLLAQQTAPETDPAQDASGAEADEVVVVDATSGEGAVDTGSAPDVFNEVQTRGGMVIESLQRGEFDTESMGILFVDLVLPALLIIVVLIVAYVLGKFLSRVTSTLIGTRVDETLGKFFGKVVFWAIMVFAILGVLQKAGIGIAAFAAALAAAGFAVGLALQGSLSSFAAGIMLLALRPFKVGQVVNAGGVFGKINEIDFFHTTFDTFDNRRLVVPNSEILNSTIENVSFHAERRADVSVGVEYSANIDQTRAVLERAAGSIEGVIQGEGRGCQVVLLDLGASSVDWSVRIWVPTADYWPKREALVRAVKMHLDEAGLGIPFPQMDVHIDGYVKQDDVS